MERRAERLVKRIVEQQGELLKKRPKQAARVAGKTEKNPIYKKDPSMVDERTYLKEHDGLDKIDPGDVSDTRGRTWIAGGKDASRKVRDNARVRVSQEVEPSEVTDRLHRLPPAELKPTDNVSLEALQEKGIHIAEE